jgi:hypothetical protein
MADRVACSCVTCPKCGTWVIVRAHAECGSEPSKLKGFCPARDCGKEFEFDWQEARTFEVPLSLFERGHFYRSELRETGT